MPNKHKQEQGGFFSDASEVLREIKEVTVSLSCPAAEPNAQ
jgi:hypothetical protein